MTFDGDNLAAARRVAVEALILSVGDIEAGEDGRTYHERVGTVLERTWILHALGSAIEDDDRGATLSLDYCQTLRDCAEEVEWMWGGMIRDARDEGENPDYIAGMERRHGPILADVETVLRVLETRDETSKRTFFDMERGRLIAARMMAKLSPREAAAKAGITLMDLRAIEGGRRTPSSEEFVRLADAYGAKIDELTAPEGAA